MKNPEDILHEVAELTEEISEVEKQMEKLKGRKEEIQKRLMKEHNIFPKDLNSNIKRYERLMEEREGVIEALYRKLKGEIE